MSLDPKLAEAIRAAIPGALAVILAEDRLKKKPKRESLTPKESAVLRGLRVLQSLNPQQAEMCLDLIYSLAAKAEAARVPRLRMVVDNSKP